MGGEWSGLSGEWPSVSCLHERRLPRPSLSLPSLPSFGGGTGKDEGIFSSDSDEITDIKELSKKLEGRLDVFRSAWLLAAIDGNMDRDEFATCAPSGLCTAFHPLCNTTPDQCRHYVRVYSCEEDESHTGARRTPLGSDGQR